MRKIGIGKTATVYTDETYAYKVYHEGYNKDNMFYEVKVQNSIFNNTDLNVCEYEIVDDSIKMTYLKGVTFAERILVEQYEHWF